jgi:hypothetical protein
MRVSQLIDALSKLDQDAFVRVSVGWAADTAISSRYDDTLTVVAKGDTVEIGGWLPNCGTELEIYEDEE